ncbi:hypothetical protein [Streptomyces sp. ME19-01-6]|uniref:hypothetical protein n=1 Tax=Streptomyces sp. ME19-01-6 TaxID=3028686 RepID=UPI0029A3ECB3|nr:hypothetical protein [Streptomyces sp. ME19-01-6]MDX3230108.1 hypothetical protein [Streptomyces sp. ME19-01-6]
MSDLPLLLSSDIPSSCPITDLVMVEAGDGPLVVCADFYGAVWTWNPLRDVWRKRPLTYAFTEDPLAAQYPDAENEIDAVAVAVSDGRVVLAGGGDEQAPAIWDLESGELLRGATYDAPYLGAVATVRGEGPPRFVTGSQYAGEVMVRGVSADVAPVELPSEEDYVTSLATAWIGGRSLVAVGGSQIDVWDLARAERLTELYPYDVGVRAVALSRLDVRPIVAAASHSGEVYVWELSGGDDGEPIHEPIAGHEDRVCAMDTVEVGGRTLAVTGAKDETVRLWDLAEGAAVGAPLIGHRGGVEAVLTATLRGRQVVLSAGRDGTIRGWDLAALLR